MTQFSDVARCYRCNVQIAKEYALRTEEEWKLVFKEAFPERSFADHGTGYDFSAQTIIAVFLGHSAEYSGIKIEEVRDHTENLEVMVLRNVAIGEPACSPYHIVRMNKIKKKVHFKYQDRPDLSISDIKPRF